MCNSHNGEWDNSQSSLPEVADVMFQGNKQTYTHTHTNRISCCEKYLETARLNNTKLVSLL